MYAVGQALVFDYDGDNEHVKDVCGSVLEVRDLEKHPLAMRSSRGKPYYYSKSIVRSRYLVTMALNDGKTRAFYHSRMKVLV